MLSGCRPSFLKLVMQGETLRDQEIEIVQVDGTVVTKKVRVSPEEILRKMLDDKLYDPVRQILVASLEGALLEYEIPLDPSNAARVQDDALAKSKEESAEGEFLML
jgi:hypothetical protein